MDRASMKVGDIAERPLHHYEQIGLLVPSHRTSSNHQLHGMDDLLRLQQILSLRHIGLGLERVQECLDTPESSMTEVLQRHLDFLAEEGKRVARLKESLRSLIDRLDVDGECSVARITETLQMTRTMEKYYTKEQLEQLARRHQQLEKDGKRQGEED